MAAISDNGGQGKGIAEGLTQGGTEAHLTPNYYSDFNINLSTWSKEFAVAFSIKRWPFFFYLYVLDVWVFPFIIKNTCYKAPLEIAFIANKIVIIKAV